MLGLQAPSASTCHAVHAGILATLSSPHPIAAPNVSNSWASLPQFLIYPYISTMHSLGPLVPPSLGPRS